MLVNSGPNLRLRADSGFTLIEVLVAMVVVTFGLLGLAALQARALKAESEAYHRAQAILLLQDIQDRLNTNRRAAACFAGSDAGSRTKYYGKGENESAITCGSPIPAVPPLPSPSDSDAQASAEIAMRGWHNLLLGTTESISGTSIGALPDARGCISKDATTDRYYVAVSWQGLSETSAPALPDGVAGDAALTSAIDCGKDQYGAEAFRRLVWAPVRISILQD